MRISNPRNVSRSAFGTAMVVIFLSLIGIIMAVPLVYTLLQSFKGLEEIFIFPPRFWVKRPTTINYKMLASLTTNLWVPFSRYLFNSVFISVTTTCLQVVFASMAAYPLAKHDFPGKKFFFTIVVLALLFTYQVVALPQYIEISMFGMIDSYISLILPSLAYPLGMYLMRQNMISFPDSIIESARIDGASEAKVFWRIVMPSMKSVWMTMVVFSFGDMWNRSDASYIYSEQLKSLPTLLSQISAGGIARTGVAAAISVLLIIPPIFTFLFTQSNVIETMASSGMKD